MVCAPATIRMEISSGSSLASLSREFHIEKLTHAVDRQPGRVLIELRPLQRQIREHSNNRFLRVSQVRNQPRQVMFEKRSTLRGEIPDSVDIIGRVGTGNTEIGSRAGLIEGQIPAGHR